MVKEDSTINTYHGLAMMSAWHGCLGAVHRAPDSSRNRPQPCRPALGDWQLQAIGASNIRALEFGARRAALLRACCQAPLRHLAAASIKYIALQKALQKDCQLHSAAKALACLGTGVDPTTTCVPLLLAL